MWGRREMSRRDALAGMAAMTSLSVAARHGIAGPALQAQDLEEEFLKHGASGTFVHLDTATDRTLYVGEARAAQRFRPASTFKIPNTLIALQTGVIESTSEVIAWNGKPQPVADWDRDLSVADALRVSAVPHFQEIARRIGLQRYEEWLDKIGYGNGFVGADVESFWLDGPLTISAYEQAGFLAALALDELPFVAIETQQAVKEPLRTESRNGRTLYAKTGWSQASTPQIGWWVGWVESASMDGKLRIDSFALNMDIPSAAALPQRAEIGKAILGRLELY